MYKHGGLGASPGAAARSCARAPLPALLCPLLLPPPRTARLTCTSACALHVPRPSSLQRKALYSELCKAIMPVDLPLLFRRVEQVRHVQLQTLSHAYALRRTLGSIPLHPLHSFTTCWARFLSGQRGCCDQRFCSSAGGGCATTSIRTR